MRTRLAISAALAIGVSLVLGGCQSPDQSTSKSRPGEMDVFLLAGQSNMAGRGPVEAFDRLGAPNLVCLDRGEKWGPAIEPLHFDKARAGVGPGSAFGRVVAEACPDRRIGLIPAACGGSPISTWRPGAYHATTDSHPYDDAVARAKRAMTDGRLRAILWIQGESDSTAERATLYYESLKTLVVGLRHDLNAKDVPFLIGRLPRFSPAAPNSWREMVTAAQQRAAREIPGVYFVDMPVLTALPDGIHADAASAREMGRRLAGAYLHLIERK